MVMWGGRCVVMWGQVCGDVGGRCVVMWGAGVW